MVREAIHIEGSKAGRGMDSVFQRELNDGEHRAPSPWRLNTNTVKNIADDAINSLSLTIGLRISRCGHVR